jgi:hypothetical protein
VKLIAAPVVLATRTDRKMVVVAAGTVYTVAATVPSAVGPARRFGVSANG